MMEDNIHILIVTMSQKDQKIEKLIQEDHNIHLQCQCINSHINANVSSNPFIWRLLVPSISWSSSSRNQMGQIVIIFDNACDKL